MNTNTENFAGRLAGAAVAGALFLGGPLIVVPSLVPVAAAAPDCDKWKFGVLGFDVTQTSGISVHFESGPGYGPNSWESIEGRAVWRQPGRPDTEGIAKGGVFKRSIDITVNWNTGTQNVYKGQVNADGYASGSTSDNKGVTEKWRSESKLVCITAPPAQAPPPSPAMATVTPGKGNVYNVKNEPEGAGELIGVMEDGARVQLVGSCSPESWCQVTGSNVPNGGGWMWGVRPE